MTEWRVARLQISGTLALVVFAFFGNACGPANVGIDYDNRTSVALCAYPSSGDATLARCRTELMPMSTTDSGRDCDNQRSRPITVIITVKENGETIYEGRTNCGEIEDSQGRYIIEQVGDSFVVTEPFE